MKKQYKSLILFAGLIAVIIAVGFSADKTQENTFFPAGKIVNNIKKISEEINTLKLSKSFEKVRLFTCNQSPRNIKLQNKFVKKASNLIIQKESLNKFYANPQDNITLVIPVTGTEIIELELTRADIFSDDARFSVMTSTGKTSFNYNKGLYYKGIIKGDNGSLASVSIFRNNVIGIISCSEGNYILGKVDNKQNGSDIDYIYYNDRDLAVRSKFDCKFDNYYDKIIQSFNDARSHAAKIKEEHSGIANSSLPVKLYIEVGYSIFLQKDSVQEVIDYISAMFGSAKWIFQTEQIPMIITEFKVWTVPDPYETVNSALGVLKLFGVRNQDNFYGNLGHFVSTAQNSSLGSMSWLNVLCQPYNASDSSGRFAFSNIDTFYSYPTYSWTIEAITHEIGHNIGSKHTHACVWPVSPGVIGAIDSCVVAEGNCFTQTQPNFQATIMSNCYLNGAINLSAGFGQLPGDTIRYCYNRADCLFESLNAHQLPYHDSLIQNYPNPFNPITKIQFAVVKDANATLRVFDITGREVARLVNNHFYTKGFHTVNFNAADYSLSSGIYFCQLITSDAASPGNKPYSQVMKMILTK